MGITFGLPSGERTTVEADTVLIGTDPACEVRLPSDGRVQPRHARIRKTAGRWLVESVGDWLLQVGSGSPGRLSWLRPGDMIRLTESGPNLTFEPPASVTPASVSPPVASVPSPVEPDELALVLDPEPELSISPASTPSKPTKPSLPPLPKSGPPPLPTKKSPPPLPGKKGPPPLPGKKGPPPLPK